MNRIILLITILIPFYASYAQDMKYRRSSMYSILIRHPEKEFGKDIDTVFRLMPLPDKFDNHNLKVRAINAGVYEKNNQTEEENTCKMIETFLTKNDIAKRLVAKWFNRKSGRGKDGTFDMNLIIERGLYDASYFDAQIAEMSTRGQSMLADAGEELIGNTYVLFNDIKYIDKEEESGLAATGLLIAGQIASQFTGGLANLIITYGTEAAVNITDKIAGFRVVVTSYLYRLNWNEEIANTFYSEYYISSPNPDRKAAFDSIDGLFSLTYLGCQKSVSEKTGLEGVHDKNDMIRKVCTRAIDKNVALLQKKYEEFKVKTPLYTTEPVAAKIGLKEDITIDSRFEVLEMVEKEDGRTEYKRVGVIKPIKGRIWDNRFMAEFEDENKGADLNATEFEIVNGSGFYPGMLIREI